MQPSGKTKGSNKDFNMMKLKHPDQLWIGLIIGAVIPFIGLGILLTIYEWLENAGLATPIGLSNQFRLRTLSILAMAMNLIPFTIYNRQYYIQTMRGIIFPTLIYVAAWVWYFNGELF